MFALYQALPHSFDDAVIVAMAVMRVVQMAVDEVINMVAVRHALVTAAWAVHVATVMPFARVIGRARRRIPAAAFQDVLVDMITVHMMQVTVVQIVGVAVVLESRVTAARCVGVRMPCVFLGGHGSPRSSVREHLTVLRCAFEYELVKHDRSEYP
jgi:hypothetical protein